MTNPDVLNLIEEQTEGVFMFSDFVPVPCCFPTCNSVTYAYLEDDNVLPLPRILDVDEYLDYITNRALPQLSPRCEDGAGRLVVVVGRARLRQGHERLRHLLRCLRPGPGFGLRLSRARCS